MPPTTTPSKPKPKPTTTTRPTKPTKPTTITPSTNADLEALAASLQARAANPGKMHWVLRAIRSPFMLKLPCIFALTLLVQCATHTVPAALLVALARCAAATLVLQMAVAVPSVLGRSELLFDLCGAGCFLVVVGLSLGSVAGGGGGGGDGGDGDVWGVGRVLAGIGRAVVTWDSGVWEEMGVDWRQGWISAVVCVWAVRCKFGSSSFFLSLWWLAVVENGSRPTYGGEGG